MNTSKTDYLVKSLMLTKPSDAMDQLVAHAENLEIELAEWRTCAERLAKIVNATESEFHLADDIEPSLIEFDKLTKKYK